MGASILPLCAVSDEPADSHLRVLRVKGKRLLRDLRLLSVDAETLPKAIDALGSALVSGLAPAQRRRAQAALAAPAVG